MQYKGTTISQYENVKKESNFTFKCTIDKTRQNRKPADRTTVSAIVKRLGEEKSKFSVSISDFAKFVTSPYSYTWAPAIFNGAKNNDNWISQQVWGLDFDDNDITPEQAEIILLEHGINANIIYTTFSDTPEKRKFRIVIIFDEIVK